MKILFISVDNNLYGANRAMLNLITQLTKNGYQCEVLLMRRGKVEMELEKNNIKYYVMKFCPWVTASSEKKWKDVLRKMYNAVAFQVIAKKLSENTYDIIHTNSSITDIGAYLSKKWRVRHIWHIRETLQQYNLKYIGKQERVKSKYAEAYKVIFISEYMKAYYKGFIPDIRSCVIYDGVQVGSDCSSLDNLDNNDFTIFCTVGAITKSKNQLLVCKAVRNLIEKGIGNFKYYIVGNTVDIQYNKEIIRFVELNGLDKWIELTGHSDNPQKYYNIADVGIMPSNGEGFGLVTLEYMANGLMTIGSMSGATPEIICSNEVGRLFRADDDQDLAHVMKWCMENKAEIRRIGRNAHLYVKEKFNAEKNIRNIITLYEETDNSLKGVDFENGFAYN